NSYRTMATGGWSALSNAQDFWTVCYRAIMNLNDFLSVVEQVNWKASVPGAQDAFVMRLSGEAYALRGVMKYYLLQNHAGKGTDGTLLGVPEFDFIASSLSDFAAPRQTFAESVASANADFQKAIDNLPMDYVDVTSIPAKYSKFSLTVDQFNEIFGSFYTQRMSGRIAMAYKARLALLAASPRFNESGDATLWQNAANANADVLKDLGGLSYFDPKGNLFWEKAQVDDSDLSGGDQKDTKEIIWRREISNFNNNSFETNNYAPSVFGHGQINPTQNFVDAFPMKNGYPITDASSGYDPQNPYADRDPRLAQIVVYDGSTEWGKVIKILDGTTEDAIGKTEYSTRTGYYMRKHLREDVSVQPNKTSTQKHVVPRVRATEIFLNYAEAANEAWGPDGKGSAGYSAKDVITAIRNRAGLDDEYISKVTSKEDMRKLIRNERRIELSFEGARFWDLRRWKADLTEPAKGIRRTAGGILETFQVEERAYQPYQIYGPIPFNEVLKFGYVQNQGW
ncbi:MAG: RagB/SusD family nutrient uptake outer membrane protein, partial [Bacteroidales bacterium]|nr:RagB/SusD family nutrient uptake outer membrane protein [Bacteroidales bacterium]